MSFDEYDDLAVAYERLEQWEKALKTLERKRARLKRVRDNGSRWLKTFQSIEGEALSSGAKPDLSTNILRTNTEVPAVPLPGRKQY